MKAIARIQIYTVPWRSTHAEIRRNPTHFTLAFGLGLKRFALTIAR